MTHRSRLALCVGIVVAPVALATDYVVNPGQSIQAAMTQAVSGDRVLVQPGTYLQTINFFGKAIEVIGVGGAAATVLDGGGAPVEVVAMINGEPAGAVLDGFTVRNALTGIYIASGAKPTIRRTVVEDHTILGLTSEPRAGDGVHVAVFSGSFASLSECVLRNNQGSGVQGETSLVRCLVSGNLQTACAGARTLSECRIQGNFGGGIQIDDGLMSPVTIDRCVITGNMGSGVAGFGTYNVTIKNSLIADNHTTGKGGGISFSVYNPATVSILGAVAIVENCVVVNNTATSGGGAFLSALAQTNPASGFVALRRCTLANNVPDGAVFSAQYGEIRNCNLWSQPAPFTQPFVSLVVDHCDIQGAYPGVGNFDADPLFVDPANGDYHLRAGSPCIDAGTGSAPDFEGDAAVGITDVGGDEFRPHLYVTGHASPGAALKVNVVASPGAAPGLFFASTTRLEPGITTPFGKFGLGVPLIPGFPLDFGTIPAGSLIAIPTSVPPAAPVGVSVYLQAFVGGAGATLTNVESIVIG